nr:MAG: putative coat protein [Tombusviridae sp.]
MAQEIVPFDERLEVIPVEEPYDEFIDLRGYGRAEQSAIESVASLNNIESRFVTAATSWLASQIERGATIVGNAVLDAAGRAIGRVTKSGAQKLVEQISEMPKRMAPKKNAPVKNTPVRKTRQPAAMPVYSRMPTVAAPVAVSKRVNIKSKPLMKSGKRGLVITHREMIGQIITGSTGTNFTATGFICNPGRFSTFPWLSSLAGNFDKYRMLKLRFTTLSNQATTTAGRVGLGFDLDSTDPLPADRNEFFAMTYHAECSPWDSVSLDIPMDGKDRFVNSHTISDSKLIDVGQIVFISDAVTNAGVSQDSKAIADVIVEYTVELLDPQQAIYSTQSFYAKNSAVATMDLISSSGPLVMSPSNVSPYVSTSTILYGKVLQGYYVWGIHVGDADSGSPTVAVAIHGGTGTNGSYNGSTQQMTNTGIFNITSNDGVVRITIGGVTLANLESFVFTISRISASVYSGLNAVTYSATTTTF